MKHYSVPLQASRCGGQDSLLFVSPPATAEKAYGVTPMISAFEPLEPRRQIADVLVAPWRWVAVE